MKCDIWKQNCLSRDSGENVRVEALSVQKYLREDCITFTRTIAYSNCITRRPLGGAARIHGFDNEITARSLIPSQIIPADAFEVGSWEDHQANVRETRLRRKVKGILARVGARVDFNLDRLRISPKEFLAGLKIRISVEVEKTKNDSNTIPWTRFTFEMV